MTTQDPELSAALGWPGGTSDPVLDRKTLLQMVAAMRLASQQALEALTAHADLLGTMYLKMDAITALRAALAQQDAQKEKPWRCACGANLYIDENGAPRSKS